MATQISSEHVYSCKPNAFSISILSCAAVALITLRATANTQADRGTGAGSHSAKLMFAPNGKGQYAFDTGVLHGKLRPDGSSLGLSSVIHAPSGIRLDGRFGILSYYRIFTTNKRYGHAAWDRSSLSKLLPDGAVRIVWPAGTDHPFEMTAVYRWKEPSTLDLKTTVKAQKDLGQFEVFLASYFRENLPAPYVYVSGNPETAGKPGFLMAKKSSGDWQMFPRDEDVLRIIHDGRWQKEPNPVKWAIMPYMAAPLGVRRSNATALTVVLMAPPDDCFAIATPYRGETHYSLYLSLFGRDVKAGETATCHSRLVVAGSISNEQILALYQEYVKELPGIAASNTGP